MMDKEYFMNATMPLSWTEEQQSFLNSCSSMDHHFSHFDSMVSSPAAATTSNDAFALIGKLGGGARSYPPPASPYIGTHNNNNNNNNNGSCYNTPLSSSPPPKLNLPDHHMNNMPNFVNSAPLPSLSSDPGFAERAARFSCFGSRSFNERTPPQHRSGSPLKLPRVASTPSFRQGGLSVENSNEESSVSEQIPSGESGANSTRKRKPVSRGKPKEDGLALVKGHEDGNGKRSKQQTESGKNGKTETKDGGGDSSNDESEKQKTNQEPPKDYIHVRARRGQATDSHSLAERVRREKISERMKLLQDIVPGCNKVTGKALMLDEIINYVQSLQRQVEFLSMKLATVNPEVDSNMDNLLTKDMFQQNANVPQQMYPMDSSPPPAFYNHHNPNMNSTQNPVDPLSLDAPLCRNNLGLQLHSLEGFNQFAAFGEDDLHSIVNQMGFGQNHGNFPVPNQSSDMKVER